MHRSRIISCTAFLLSMTLGACGGSGGGSDDSGGGGSGPGGSGLQRVNFSEDTTLNSDLGGVWIATIHTQATSSAGQESSSSERDVRQALYIIDDPATGLTIRNCETNVDGLSSGSNSLAFQLYEHNLELHIDSNTHLSGSAESMYGATGNVTMIKVMAAPNPLPNLSLGTLRYTYNGSSEVTANIQCYYEEHLIARYQSTSESYSHFVSIYEIGDHLQNAIRLTTDYYDDEPDELRNITLNLNGINDQFHSDSSENLEFSVSGTDEINVTFRAVDDNHFLNGNVTSATLTGSATLNF